MLFITPYDIKENTLILQIIIDINANYDYILQKYKTHLYIRLCIT